MNTVDALQHQINSFGVVTVMDVLLKDTVTGEPVLLLDTLKITSIDQEGQQKEIRGGIGAPELISYDYARTISLEIQDALASMSSLKLLWGGRFIEDSFDYHAVFEAKVEDGEIELPEGVVANEDDIENTLIIDRANDKKYTADEVESGKIKLTDVDANSAVVKVFLPATATVEKDVGALAINSMDLPPTMHMVGHTYVINQATGKQEVMEIEVPLLKFNISGGITMEAEGDAAVFDFNGRALRDPATRNFFTLKTLGEAK